MPLDEVIIILRLGDIEALVRNQPSLIKGIFTWMAQSDEFIVRLKVWERQLGCPIHCFKGNLSPPFQLFRQHREVPFGWDAVKSSDAHIDRMDLPATQQADNMIACLLHLKRTLHDFRVVFRHLYNIGIPEIIRCMQHEDMQPMTLNPFAAVDEPP